MDKRAANRAILDALVTEADHQAVIVRMAELYGWRWFHDTDPRRDRAGFPDLVLVRPGRLVLAELKTETGQPTTEQRQWLADLATVEGPHVAARLWRPSDMDAIERELSAPYDERADRISTLKGANTRGYTSRYGRRTQTQDQRSTQTVPGTAGRARHDRRPKR